MVKFLKVTIETTITKVEVIPGDQETEIGPLSADEIAEMEMEAMNKAKSADPAITLDGLRLISAEVIEV